MDYAKKKNDELAALCKERGLAHTGKKADLVKRLEDHDAQGSAKPAEKKVEAEDEIDWDDEPATDAKTETKTETAKPAAKPEAAPAAKVDAPTSTSDATEKQPEANTEAAEEKKPEFQGLGLQDASLDEEIAKRKKRAQKFGLDPSKDETLKQLERAKRFGTTDVPGLLNKALPERAERNKKRGREGRDEKPDRKRSRQRTDKQDARPEQKEKSGERLNWMSAEDREKAEKRKAKFAAAA